MEELRCKKCGSTNTISRKYNDTTDCIIGVYCEKCGSFIKIITLIETVPLKEKLESKSNCDPIQPIYAKIPNSHIVVKLVKSKRNYSWRFKT